MAVAMACMAIEAGVCNTVVVGYGRDTWSRTHRTAEARQAVASRPRTYSEFGSEFGQFGAPVNYAVAARRHMERFGTTKAQLGAIAVAFRNHARKNPHAFMQKPLTLDEYLSARLIVDPLCLYDCSVFIDGAGAVVVTTAGTRPRPAAAAGPCPGLRLRQPPERLARRRQHDHHRRQGGRGGGLQDGGHRPPGTWTPRRSTTASRTWCCCNSRTTASAPRGKGGPFVASGALEFDGVLPTNTSGGQLSEGHIEGIAPGAGRRAAGPPRAHPRPAGEGLQHRLRVRPRR